MGSTEHNLCLDRTLYDPLPSLQDEEMSVAKVKAEILSTLPLTGNQEVEQNK